MKARLPLLALLGCALAGFALRADLRPGAEVDPAVFRANHERWMQLGEAEREALRERWQGFATLPSGERETLLQRAETLRRLNAALARRAGRAPDAEEAAAELRRVAAQARRFVAPALARDAAPADAELLAALEARTRRHVEAFLDNLERHGRLAPAERARLAARAPSEQLSDALLLLKAEQIELYAEGVPAAEANDLLPLSPLDVAERAERRRRQEGFLGRLGQALPLTDDERRTLGDADGWREMLEHLRDLKAPQIRELLVARGVPPERIETLLVGPISELEREVNELLRSARAAAAARPAVAPAGAPEGGPPQAAPPVPAPPR